MTQFTSNFNVTLHIFTLLILLIIFVNNQKISANSIHRKNDYLFDDDQSKFLSERDNLSYDSIDDETSSYNIQPRIFRPSHVATIPSINLRRRVIHLIPYKKRTIPLELQKALYAHGIVGRRR